MPSALLDAPTYASLTSPELDAAVDAAHARTLTRQAALEARWLPHGFKRWSCDQEEGVIRFLHADGTGIEASVQILGSYAPRSSSWEWAWNNPNVADELSRDAGVVRAYGEARDHAPLATGIMQISPEQSRRLIGLAAELVSAEGLYWGVSGGLLIAIAYRDIRPIAERDAQPPTAASEPDAERDDDAEADDEESSSLFRLLLSWLGSSVMTLAFGRYYVDPMVLKRMAPIPVGNEFVPLTAEHEARIAPYLLEDMAEIEATLAERGFTRPYRVTSQTGDEITNFASLVEHPGHSTIGFVIVNASQYTGVTRIATFETHFTKGPKMSTTNFDIVSFTPSVPDDDVRFPDVVDAGALYDIHRARVMDRAWTDPALPLTRAPDPIAYLDRETREVRARWVQWGYYRLTSGDAMVRTWRGAILGAWRGLFPWKQLTQRAQARKRADVERRIEP
jgi:hypothetical protein